MSRGQDAGRLFAAGLEHQRSGRLPEARACYEQGLQFAPGNPDATFLLGQVLFETGEGVAGEALMRKAIKVAPHAWNYWRGLAIQLFNQERFDEARKAFAQAITLNSSDADLGAELALALESCGETAGALEQWQRVVMLQPGNATAWLSSGRLLLRTGRAEDAVAAVERHLHCMPDSVAGWTLHAEANEILGQHDVALHSLVQAATVSPDDALLRARLAQSLCAAGLAEAGIEQFEEASRLAPGNAGLHFQRGAAYGRLGLPQQACAAYEAALALDPEAPAILVNLANQYGELRRNDEARALYARAVSVAPDFAAAHFNLGMLLIDEGRRLDAEASLSRACTLAPDNGLMAAHLLFQRMHLCEWDGLAALAQRVSEAVLGDREDIPPFIVLSMPGTTPELQRRCAENHTRRLISPLAGLLPPVEHTRSARLRIGYLSSDFKNHATAYLMAEMLEAHDRSRFEIFGLSYGIDDRSAMRARMRAALEHFVELADCPAREAVDRIAALDLDILIDLKGYTEGNHSEWLQYRLAPVQINWLGYPGTLAAPWVDYIVADAVVAPLSHQSMFSERLLHLPGCYQPNCRERVGGRRPTRAEAGLPEGAVVLCSFNQTYKITPEMFAVWMNILHRVPHAVLWLWASNPWAEQRLRVVAMAQGIAPDRLIFAEGKPQADHLARLPLADLALDTFPCNGHTTTSDALWAGVPVVTLQGSAFAARVASSLLVAGGFDQLVAESMEHYAEIVINACLEPGAMAVLRRRAEALKTESALFDGVSFARRFENLLEHVSP